MRVLICQKKFTLSLKKKAMLKFLMRNEMAFELSKNEIEPKAFILSFFVCWIYSLRKKDNYVHAKLL